MNFTGDYVRAKKISLAGKSQQAESRAQVLERTHLERERRKQQKLENNAATTIQVRNDAGGADGTRSIIVVVSRRSSLTPFFSPSFHAGCVEIL